MSVDLTGALSAYNEAAKRLDAGGMRPRDGAGGPDFGKMVREAAEGAVETLRRSETTTLRAAAGQADLTDVVTAVSQADITLRTVVAVRDRVVQAYQDILRMPI